MKRVCLVLLLVVAGVGNIFADEIRYPESQKSFIGNVLAAKAGYKSGQNAVAQGNERIHRKHNLDSYKNKKAENWIGTIYQMSTVSDGSKAWLRVQIDLYIILTTSKSERADEGIQSLIPWRTDVYDKLLALKTGDWIMFSGRFFPSKEDGVQEISLTMHGSMTDPEFLFKFIDIKKINKDNIKVDSIFSNRF